MLRFLYTGLIASGLLLAAGCNKKFDEYSTNPNRPEQTPPSLVFTAVASDLNVDRPWSLVSRWNQFDLCNYNYYGDQRYDWTGASWNFTTLNNVRRMEEEARRINLGEVNAYSALAKFMKAFFYYRMTSLNGDLPLTEALQGVSKPNPKYDSQKDVFRQILQWLDEANTDLQAVIAQSGDIKVDGDIYFGGKGTLSSWRKVVNAFQLRVLIALSKKESDPDLNIKSRFAAILGDAARYPLMESEADNLQYTYSNVNKYPSNPDNLGFDATRYNMSATYLNTLVSLNDPRAFITAEPATAQLKAGKTPADITVYVGANPGEDLADMSSKMANANEAAYSVRSRSRYYSSYAPEPGIIIGYAEQCFNIAEAANRGWVSADAESWYKKGIRSSLANYGVPVNGAGTVTKVYPFNAPGATTYNIPFDFEGVYYRQPSVAYAGNTTAGLNQILLQKYLAFFQNSGWEAYFNHRRTGVPQFGTGTGTGNGGVIPKRFQYPSSEQTTNRTAWAGAVQEQFGATDDINASMWLIK
ncbi:MAG TPA: SusD/RagB family nutrient-binding outer membrane lipoprotein [Chitinophagaceae bacterium]|jgi:hypothetical protein|nr:SusD/RagB family nutrient-binding outer membrane lipoprotein [Chitinophagaceae bacterium]